MLSFSVVSFFEKKDASLAKDRASSNSIFRCSIKNFFQSNSLRIIFSIVISVGFEILIPCAFVCVNSFFVFNFVITSPADWGLTFNLSAIVLFVTISSFWLPVLFYYVYLSSINLDLFFLPCYVFFYFFWVGLLTF
jgi:hypothetical protein